MSREDFLHCCAPLAGRRMESVGLQDFTWIFEFDRSVAICTESPWRLVGPDRTIASSEDHGHRFALKSDVDSAERVRAHLDGKLVLAASIAPRTGDLRVEFEGGFELQWLQLSTGYESWRLTGVGGEFVCCGGGAIHDRTPR